MLKIAVALCLVAYTTACCFPAQWEGWIGIELGMYNTSSKKSTIMEGGIHISYDDTNKILSETQNLLYDDTAPVTQNVVMDFSQKIMFVINNGTCVKYRLGEPFDRCFLNSGESNRFTYGFGSNSVRALGYRVQLNESTVYMAVEEDTCLPISADTITRMQPYYQFQIVTYSNVTAGIKDRSVFNVPTACAAVSEIRPSVPMAGFGKRSLSV